MEEIVKYVRVRTIKAGDNGTTSFKDLKDGSGLRYLEHRHRKFGRCYTCKLEDRIMALGVYYFTLKL